MLCSQKHLAQLHHAFCGNWLFVWPNLDFFFFFFLKITKDFHFSQTFSQQNKINFHFGNAQSVNYFKDNETQMSPLVSQQRFNVSLAVRSFTASKCPQMIHGAHNQSSLQRRGNNFHLQCVRAGKNLYQRCEIVIQFLL